MTPVVLGSAATQIEVACRSGLLTHAASAVARKRQVQLPIGRPEMSPTSNPSAVGLKLAVRRSPFTATASVADTWRVPESAIAHRLPSPYLHDGRGRREPVGCRSALPAPSPRRSPGYAQGCERSERDSVQMHSHVQPSNKMEILLFLCHFEAHQGKNVFHWGRVSFTLFDVSRRLPGRRANRFIQTQHAATVEES